LVRHSGNKLSEQTPEGGVASAGENPHYFDDPVLDCLTNMLLELAAEVWVNRERALIVEQMLQQQNLISSDAVEKYVPSEEQQQGLREERDRFVGNIMREIKRLAAQHGTGSAA